MNRRDWHIPAGIAISILAHFGAISLIVAAAKMKPTALKAAPLPAKVESNELESYPTFEEKPSPMDALDEILAPEKQEVAQPKKIEPKIPAPRYPEPNFEISEEYPSLFENQEKI